MSAAQSNLDAAKAGGEQAKENLDKAKEALATAQANLKAAQDAKAAADQAASEASENLAAAKQAAADAQNEAEKAKTDADAKSEALKTLTGARDAYDDAQKAAEDAKAKADEAAKAAKDAEAKAEELAGKQAGLDEAAKAAQAKADAFKAVSNEMDELPSDADFLADPTTVDPVIDWLKAYDTDDADVKGAVDDYVKLLEEARQAALDALGMQGQVDSDQKDADAAKTEADAAKRALDKANHDLAIKQAIDRAMNGNGTVAGASARHATEATGVTAAYANVTKATYTPKHMASELPKTGDTSVPAAPLAAVGFVALAAAEGVRRKRRD